MNVDIKKFPRLFLGLFCYALGITFSVQANIGVDPWTVFHQGITNIIPVTLGQATMIVGTLIVFMNFIFKEKIGIGTIFNMFLIGYFIDLIFALKLIPKSTSMVFSIIMVISGMFILAFATYLYVGAGMGSGPRDGLMIVFKKKTSLPVGIVRGVIELTVLIIGILLGGQIGIGTIILVLLIGPIVQFTFKILQFNIENIDHTYLTR